MKTAIGSPFATTRLEACFDRDRNSVVELVAQGTNTDVVTVLTYDAARELQDQLYELFLEDAWGK